MATRIETRVPCSVLQDCTSRYILRQVNYCLFLYDTQEDIYIPAQVISDLFSGQKEAK